MMTKFIV
jgi:hypothetical protein